MVSTHVDEGSKYSYSRRMDDKFLPYGLINANIVGNLFFRIEFEQYFASCKR